MAAKPRTEWPRVQSMRDARTTSVRSDVDEAAVLSQSVVGDDPDAVVEQRVGRRDDQRVTTPAVRLAPQPRAPANKTQN